MKKCFPARSSDFKEELEKANSKSKMEDKEEELINLTSEENYNTKILEKDEIIKKLLTEVEVIKSSRKKRVIGVVIFFLLIGVLIYNYFLGIN